MQGMGSRTAQSIQLRFFDSLSEISLWFRLCISPSEVVFATDRPLTRSILRGVYMFGNIMSVGQKWLAVGINLPWCSVLSSCHSYGESGYEDGTDSDNTTNC